MSDGSHDVYHTNPTVTFLAMVTGLDQFCSYGMLVGSRAAAINAVCCLVYIVALNAHHSYSMIVNKHLSIRLFLIVVETNVSIKSLNGPVGLVYLKINHWPSRISLSENQSLAQ